MRIRIRNTAYEDPDSQHCLWGSGFATLIMKIRIRNTASAYEDRYPVLMDIGIVVVSSNDQLVCR